VGGAVYCLEALHGERRDRSLLFWKSLPVSDRTAVLAKLAVPLIVVPAVAIAVTLALQLVMLIVSTLVLAATGSGAGLLWSRLPFVQMPMVMVYGVLVHALWFAPLYAWILFVSAWARRMPVAWVVLPPLVVGMAEHIAIRASLVGRLLRWRLMGAMGRAFDTSDNGGMVLIATGTSRPSDSWRARACGAAPGPPLVAGPSTSAASASRTDRLTRMTREPRPGGMSMSATGSPGRP
jgi:ABC-2 type transport system permease protein